MARRTTLLRRGLLLEYATLGWNVVGVVIVAVAAVGARSVALAGFGLDSLIEIFASVPYILVQSAVLLLSGTRPHASPLGIAWLAVTVVAMLLLAQGKRVTGGQLGNPVLRKEGYVTLIDAALAAAVLAGLVLNAALGWWWADPLAGLVIVYYGIREGIAACRGEE